MKSFFHDPTAYKVQDNPTLHWLSFSLLTLSTLQGVASYSNLFLTQKKFSSGGASGEIYIFLTTGLDRRNKVHSCFLIACQVPTCLWTVRLNVTLNILLNVHRLVMFIYVAMTQRAQNSQIAVAIVVFNSVDMVCVQTLFLIGHSDSTLCTRPVMFFSESSGNLWEILSVSTSFRILRKGFWEMLHHRQVAIVLLKKRLNHKVIYLFDSPHLWRLQFESLVLKSVKAVLTGK